VSSCPRCGAESIEGFGLVTCGSCGNLFVVDEPDERDPAVQENASEEDSVVESQGENSIESLLSPDADLREATASTPEEPAYIPDLLPSNESVGSLEFEDTSTSEKSQEWPPTQSDIQGFSETSQQLGMGGNLKYELRIDLSHAPDELDQVMEVLSYEKLRIDRLILSELKKNLKVLLKDLNALKTIFILKSLESLDVQIQWESKDETES